MYNDQGKRKERRKAALDEAVKNFTGFTYQGGMELSEIAATVRSCRYSQTGISERTLQKWIRQDLRDCYMIIRHHWHWWLYQI